MGQFVKAMSNFIEAFDVLAMSLEDLSPQIGLMLLKPTAGSKEGRKEGRKDIKGLKRI